jgi:hypothetical protein
MIYSYVPTGVPSECALVHLRAYALRSSVCETRKVQCEHLWRPSNGLREDAYLKVLNDIVRSWLRPAESTPRVNSLCAALPHSAYDAASGRLARAGIAL